MNTSTIEIIITILLFIILNDPLLKFLEHNFGVGFWMSEIVIALFLILIIVLLNLLVFKVILKNRHK